MIILIIIHLISIVLFSLALYLQTNIKGQWAFNINQGFFIIVIGLIPITNIIFTILMLTNYYKLKKND